jgi:hypothetical protein
VFFFVCLSQFRFLLAKVASACAHVCAGTPSQKDGWVAWQINDVSVERQCQQPIYCMHTIWSALLSTQTFRLLAFLSFLSPFEGNLPGILLSLLSYHPGWLFASLCSFVVKLAYFVFTSGDLQGPCLDYPQKLEFFHSLSITSIFGRMHGAVNVDKKNN